MAELKPCPNPECVCEADWMHEGTLSEGIVYWIECCGCDMQGPVSRSSNEAARLWNALPRNVTPDVASPQDRPAEDDKLMLPAMAVIRRERFAIEAMKALLQDAEAYVGNFPDGIATDAWRVADAMLEHREGVGDDEA